LRDAVAWEFWWLLVLAWAWAGIFEVGGRGGNADVDLGGSTRDCVLASKSHRINGGFFSQLAIDCFPTNFLRSFV